MRNNENAVEEALLENEKAIEDIKNSFDPPKLLVDESGREVKETEKTSVAQHMDNYNKFKTQYKEDFDNGRWSLETLTEHLKENPIECIKYNYTLEKELMNHYQFDCKLQVSKDGKSLLLYNNKMSTYPTYEYE